MEHGQEDGPLDSEFVAALGEQGRQDRLAAGLLPQPLADESGADALAGDDGRLAVGVGGEQEGMLGEASAGGEQGVELAGGLQMVEAAEGGEDALAGTAALTGVLDDLHVAARAGRFDAEEQGALGNRDTMIVAGEIGKSRPVHAEAPPRRGTRFSRNGRRRPGKTSTYGARNDRKCRRRVWV